MLTAKEAHKKTKINLESINLASNNIPEEVTNFALNKISYIINERSASGFYNAFIGVLYICPKSGVYSISDLVQFVKEELERNGYEVIIDIFKKDFIGKHYYTSEDLLIIKWEKV